MTKHGFTLIELLVVVLVIGVLTSIALPQYRSAMDRSRAAEAKQMLPAIFSARERWMVENGCDWSAQGSTNYTCDTDTTLRFSKLDIDFSVQQSMTQTKMVTPNFTYTLVTPSSSTKQPCVSASPRWGGERMRNAVIYYRGIDFGCNNGGNENAPCDKLSVDAGDGDAVCK